MKFLSDSCKFLSVIGFCALLVGSAGCGGGDSSSGTTTGVQSNVRSPYSGTWNGPYSDVPNLQQGSINLTIASDGGVTGTLTSTSSATSKVTGSGTVTGFVTSDGILSINYTIGTITYGSQCIIQISTAGNLVNKTTTPATPSITIDLTH